MAISLLEQNTVNAAVQAAKTVLTTLDPVLRQLNVIYDSVGGVKTTLTDAKLAEVPAFSGLTKAQLDDGCYALTATLRSDIAAAYTALAVIAARA